MTIKAVTLLAFLASLLQVALRVYGVYELMQHNYPGVARLYVSEAASVFTWIVLAAFFKMLHGRQP